MPVSRRWREEVRTETSRCESVGTPRKAFSGVGRVKLYGYILSPFALWATEGH